MTEEFYEDERGREIYESIPDFPVCAYEGCDEIVQSTHPWHSLYCSRKCFCEANPYYWKEYQQTPEGKVRRARADKKYRQTPKGKAYNVRSCAVWLKANKDWWNAKRRAKREANKDEINAQRRAKRAAERLAAEEQTSP